MVGATGSRFNQSLRALRVHKPKNFLVVLHSADETALLAHLATQPRKNRGKDLTALFRRERLIFRPAKRRLVAAVRGIFLFDECSRLLNQIERGEVTVLVIIGPV